MTILAAMWELSNCNPGKSPAALVAYVAASSSNTTYFSNSYARYGLSATKNSAEYTLDLGADYSEFWLHFDVAVVNAPSVTTEGWIEMYDSAKVLQFRLAYSGTTSQHILARSTNGSTFTNVDGTDTFTMVAATRYTVDVRLKASATVGEAAVYVNEALSNVNVTGDVSSQANNVRYIVFKSESTSNTEVFSQIAVSTTNTVGWKVQTLTPLTGAGGVAQWSGTFDDIDDTTLPLQRDKSMTTNTVNNRHSFPTTDVAAAASALLVQGIMLGVRGHTTEGATATDIKAMLRVSSTNYDSSALGFTINQGEEPRFYTWELNPNTGNPWTQAEINAMQMGFTAA